MQREIKFRAKETSGKDWCYGIMHNEGINLFPVSVDMETVGQFIGFLDTHKREIYEGDIIKFHFMTSSPSTSELFPTKSFLGEITTNKYNQWTILSDGLEIHIENAIKYGEIIGNIYDNKELLEE